MTPLSHHAKINYAPLSRAVLRRSVY